MNNAPRASEEFALLHEISAGLRDATILEDRYKPRLLWFARVMGVPGEDCSDLVQDVLLVAIREIRSDRFRGDSALITWLDGILKNKIKDFWRARNRRRSIFTPLEPLVTAPKVAQNFATRSPRQWDEDIDVRAVLDRMPSELRTILLLNEAEGLTVEEIALERNRPPGTIGRKLAEAKKIFRESMPHARVRTARSEKARAASFVA
jgi:RNA polymerase sigma factor (sigma-70 family)